MFILRIPTGGASRKKAVELNTLLDLAESATDTLMAAQKEALGDEAKYIGTGA